MLLCSRADDRHESDAGRVASAQGVISIVAESHVNVE